MPTLPDYFQLIFVQMRFERTLRAFYFKSRHDFVISADWPTLPVSQNGINNTFHTLHTMRLIAVLRMVKQRQGSFDTNAISDFHNGVSITVKKQKCEETIISQRWLLCFCGFRLLENIGGGLIFGVVADVGGIFGWGGGQRLGLAVFLGGLCVLTLRVFG